MLQLYTLNYYTSLSNIGYISAVVPLFRVQSDWRWEHSKQIEKQPTTKKSQIMAYRNDGYFPLYGEKLQLVTRLRDLPQVQ